jgi:DNA-binding MarR family transcriptional regulator
MSKSVKAGGALKRSPVHLLHRALQLGLDIYAQETGAGGVTQRQFAVLSVVSANDGLSQTDLVRATGIDRSTVAELVARMTGAGLLARQRAAGDARTNMVHLTERGRELLEEAAPKVTRADKRLLKLLPGKKREEFVEMLQLLMKQAGADGQTADDAEPKADKPAKRERKAKAAVDAAAPDGASGAD